MGKGRYLYDDLGAAVGQFTASSIRDGQVGLAVKVGSGSAVGLAGGPFTGATDAQYRVEIDSIAGGAEVGQATFRWRDGSVTGWNASGVLTSASPVTLNNGATFKWTTGAGADFVVADRWDFTAAAFFGIRQLIDRDRDSAFRSKSLGNPEWIRRDLGSALQVTACVLADHNLTSAATIALKANSADSWTSPPFSLAIPWASGTIVAYLNQSYRYWRLEITDTGNPAGYLELGEWFLGSYLEPAGNFDRGWSQDRVPTETIIRTDAGARRHLVQSREEHFTLAYELLAQADLDSLLAVEAAVHDVANLRGRPFWFHRDSDVAAEIYLVSLVGGVQRTSPFLNRYAVGVQLEEIPRTLR